MPMPLPMHLRANHRQRLPRRAFTIIEILVVVSMIVVLIAILLPSLGKAKTIAQVAGAKSELGAIQQGMQSYYNVFHMYPPSGGSDNYLGNGSGSETGRGAAMLAQGLMGYLDYNKDGAGPSNPNNPSPPDPPYGFRTRNSSMGGTIYGPYMQPDPKVLRVNGPTDQSFIDPWGHEILYYLSQGQTPATTSIFASGGTNAIFNQDDCTLVYDPAGNITINPQSPTQPGADAAKFFPLFTPGNNNSYSGGIVTGADSFILISPGPDGIYFSSDDIVVGKN